jgi:hypothetical protein
VSPIGGLSPRQRPSAVFVRAGQVLGIPPRENLIQGIRKCGIGAPVQEVIPDYINESTAGVPEGLRRRVVMPFAGATAETDHVLGHELVHAFQ